MKGHSVTSLTQDQIDYITTTTNTRGADFVDQYQFFGTQLVVAPDFDWLNIVGQLIADPAIVHGYSKKGPHGWNDGTVSEVFKNLVGDVLTGVERHM